MTVSTPTKPNWLIALGIPFLIFFTCLIITLTVKFTPSSDVLLNAILGDLLITAPVVYYFAIRKSNVSSLTVIKVFIIGLLFAGIILKGHSNPILSLIKTWISPILEASVIFLIGRKFYTANKKAKVTNTDNVDFLLHSRTVMFEIVGNSKIANLLSSEIAVIYYAFFGGKAKSIDYQIRFTNYKQNGLPVILYAILCIFIIETAGVHFILILWSKIIAWVITGLSIYTCLQLFAHIRAVKARPIMINANSFEVHNGLAGDAVIEFDNIEKIGLSNIVPIGRKWTKISLLKGMENHNIVVTLKRSIEATKIYGIKREVDTVLFFVDRPKEFINEVTSQIEKRLTYMDRRISQV